MAKKLKNLRITDVALCQHGMNPEAQIQIFKSADEAQNESGNSNVFKDFFNALKQHTAELLSVKSNKKDEGVEDVKFDKSKMTPEHLKMFEQLEKQYGDSTPPLMTTNDAGAATPPVGADALLPGATTLVCAAAEAQSNPIDKSSDSVLHPDIKKMMEDFMKAKNSEVEQLRKAMEMNQLINIAKCYEVLGKKPEELAVTLYDLKKSGDKIYAEHIALLDELVKASEMSGLYNEIGKSASGGGEALTKIEAVASEICKAEPNISREEAFVKACEQNPELHAEYEKSYRSQK